jgi:hypothetical protein
VEDLVQKDLPHLDLKKALHLKPRELCRDGDFCVEASEATFATQVQEQSLGLAADSESFL